MRFSGFSGRRALDNNLVGHVSGHDRSGSDHSLFPDPHQRQHGRTQAHQGFSPDRALAAEYCAWSDVGVWADDVVVLYDAASV